MPSCRSRRNHCPIWNVGFAKRGSTRSWIGDADDPIGAALALTDGFGNRVDLLVGLRGLEPAAFSRVLDVPFQGERLRIIGREDFIAMKLVAHGPQDIVDAELAIAGAGGELDVALLKRLAAGYGPETIAALEKALASNNRSIKRTPRADPRETGDRSVPRGARRRGA